MEQELLAMDEKTMMAQRLAKFRQMGCVLEDVSVNPHIQRSLKKKDKATTTSSFRSLLPDFRGMDTKAFAVEANSTPVNAVTRGEFQE